MGNALCRGCSVDHEGGGGDDARRRRRQSSPVRRRQSSQEDGEGEGESGAAQVVAGEGRGDDPHQPRQHQLSHGDEGGAVIEPDGEGATGGHESDAQPHADEGAASAAAAAVVAGGGDNDPRQREHQSRDGEGGGGGGGRISSASRSTPRLTRRVTFCLNSVHMTTAEGGSGGSGYGGDDGYGNPGRDDQGRGGGQGGDETQDNICSICLDPLQQHTPTLLLSPSRSQLCHAHRDVGTTRPRQEEDNAVRCRHQFHADCFAVYVASKLTTGLGGRGVWECPACIMMTITCPNCRSPVAATLDVVAVAPTAPTASPSSSTPQTSNQSGPPFPMLPTDPIGIEMARAGPSASASASASAAATTSANTGLDGTKLEGLVKCDLWSRDAAVVRGAMLAIVHLLLPLLARTCESHEDHKRQFILLGGHYALIRAMERHPSDATIQKRGLFLSFFDLEKRPQSVSATLAVPRTIETIVAAAHNHPENLKIQVHVFLALALCLEIEKCDEHDAIATPVATAVMVPMIIDRLTEWRDGHEQSGQMKLCLFEKRASILVKQLLDNLALAHAHDPLWCKAGTLTVLNIFVSKIWKYLLDLLLGDYRPLCASEFWEILDWCLGAIVLLEEAAEASLRHMIRSHQGASAHSRNWLLRNDGYDGDKEPDPFLFSASTISAAIAALDEQNLTFIHARDARARQR